MFYNEQEKDYVNIGSSYWNKVPQTDHCYQLSGKFSESFHHGTVHSRRFFVNQKQIYYQQKQTVYALNLHFCVMEQHFCFHNKKRIYEIKLKCRQNLTILSTDDMNIFLSFYCHLAKYCILRSLPRHFKVKQLIGQGSFSKVYNGQNILSKQQVALKIFNKNEALSETNIELVIRNQIAILRNLKSRELSPLIAVYETPNQIVLVLQKAQAGSMISYLKKHQKNYNQQFIKSILHKIAENMYQLHSAGYIHRDIKPQNILFKNQQIGSSVFFGDFGVTIHKQQILKSKIGQSMTGTIGFMAPQILKNKIYDEKCDVFSYGCLIHYLYTGKTLFNKKNMSYLIRNERALEDKLQFIFQINPLIYDLLLKVLKIEPQDRLSAEQILSHKYFQGYNYQRPTTGQQDRTIRQFVNQRINKFFK